MATTRVFDDRLTHEQPALGLAAWCRDILRDPLSKDGLRAAPDGFTSSYGRHYPFLEGGIVDLRLLSDGCGLTSQNWLAGQVAFEHFEKREYDYLAERRSVERVYEEVPIIGRCLDVGGLDGRLRAFLAADQEYLVADPFWAALSLPRSDAYRRAYPFADEPLNYVCAVAEHLPIASGCFDTVHVRSVLDHLFNPELALREAFRVLRQNGALIVGLDVLGGRHGRQPVKRAAKELVRTALVASGLSRFADHHLWHPKYLQLCRLITECGFRIEHTHWQAGTDEQVCYILAIRQSA